MNKELQKRILSSIVIICIITFSFTLHKYLWAVFILTCCILSWLEWVNILKKIKIKNNLFEVLSYFFSFSYLLFAGIIFYLGLFNPYIFILFVSTCVFSDIGGYIFGKIIGGKKLTKISPNKTISGSIGSFIFSFIIFYLILNFYLESEIVNKKLSLFWFVPFILSFINQLGDLLISFFKRKANIKNTSKLIPGHGGLLDRIDGIIFAYPLTILLMYIFV